MVLYRKLKIFGRLRLLNTTILDVLTRIGKHLRFLYTISEQDMIKLTDDQVQFLLAVAICAGAVAVLTAISWFLRSQGIITGGEDALELWTIP